jgi:hypothetical protein
MDSTVRGYLLELVGLVQIGHLSTAEDVVNVFQEAFLHHLGVIKDKHCGLIVHPCLPVQPLQIYTTIKLYNKNKHCGLIVYARLPV